MKAVPSLVVFQVYREVWPGPPPTRTTVGVAGLPVGAHIEIECVAALGGSTRP